MKLIYPAFILLLLILLLSFAGCIEPQRSSSSSASISTAVQTNGLQITTVTPTPTASPTSKEISSFSTTTPFSIETITSIVNHSSYYSVPDIPDIPWFVIYTAPISFKGETIAFAYSLTSPPLQVEADVVPKVITRTDTVLSKELDKAWKDISDTRIAPNTWLKIVIRDKLTGNVIDETGYGNGYEIHNPDDLTLNPIPHKKVILTMRTGGNYQIEVSGNNIEAKNLTVKVRKIGA